MCKQTIRADESHQVGHGRTIAGPAVMVVLCVLIALYIQCSLPTLAGVGSEVTNGTVLGSLCNTDGSPAAQTRVMLIPKRYDPVKDGLVPDSLIDTTDEGGRFSFRATSGVAFCVEAFQPSSGNRAIITGVMVNKDDTLHIPTHTIKSPGAIRLISSAVHTLDSGYVFIPGTTRFAEIQDGKAIIDSVPWGLIPMLVYERTGSSERDSIIAVDLAVIAGNTVVVANASVWSYSKKVWLNTAVSGADISSTVTNFPVLIRLREGNFDFSQARTDGGDLRFAKSNGNPLSYEIERWDAVIGLAEVWVKVDTVRGNDSTQSITMYWGNPNAADESNGAAVFDSAAGFQGVWHLNEAGNKPKLDATANGYDGLSPDSSLPEQSDGLIGKCQLFDGVSEYITMPGTADSKLNFAQDDTFSVSAWVYVDTCDKVYRTVVAKGYQQYFLWLTYFTADQPLAKSPLWEFSVFRAEDNWNMSNTAATSKTWVLLYGVRQGTSQYLYVNGELVASTSAIYPQGVSRETSNDLMIGRFLTEATYPAKFGYCFFKGRIDEVRISSVADDADRIRLCYMNQRSDDRLVEFK